MRTKTIVFGSNTHILRFYTYLDNRNKIGNKWLMYIGFPVIVHMCFLFIGTNLVVLKEIRVASQRDYMFAAYGNSWFSTNVN